MAAEKTFVQDGWSIWRVQHKKIARVEKKSFIHVKKTFIEMMDVHHTMGYSGFSINRFEQNNNDIDTLN
jgi:hypothetical protein